MDAFTISLEVYTLSGAAIAAGCVHAWRSTAREKYYARLKARLGRLRLYKLLNYVGADVDTYVHAVPASELDMEMQRCAQCTAVKTCDACLRDGKCVTDMSFCPVYGSVTRHSRLLAEERLID